jgi:acetylornithine deacetylase/succinyl-diaminopimelate desuccinylase-like protein
MTIDDVATAAVNFRHAEWAELDKAGAALRAAIDTYGAACAAAEREATVLALQAMKPAGGLTPEQSACFDCLESAIRWVRDRGEK